MKIVTTKTRRDAEHTADLVVKRGLAIKNRYGLMGLSVPLPDGCYELVRMEPRRRRS
jgi:hypothetical protein